jgi:hypothetical protein
MTALTVERMNAASAIAFSSLRPRHLEAADDDGVVLGSLLQPIFWAKIRSSSPSSVASADEVTVRDVMTPADRLDAVEFDDVLNARVGETYGTSKRPAGPVVLELDAMPRSGRRDIGSRH